MQQLFFNFGFSAGEVDETLSAHTAYLCLSSLRVIVFYEKSLLKIIDFDSVVKNTKSQNQLFYGGTFINGIFEQLLECVSNTL